MHNEGKTVNKRGSGDFGEVSAGHLHQLKCQKKSTKLRYVLLAWSQQARGTKCNQSWQQNCQWHPSDCTSPPTVSHGKWPKYQTGTGKDNKHSGFHLQKLYFMSDLLCLLLLPGCPLENVFKDKRSYVFSSQGPQVHSLQFPVKLSISCMGFLATVGLVL